MTVIAGADQAIELLVFEPFHDLSILP